jgi:16S rRNA (adenine1518-N6/adenine1519-N6)-dimethyltransferase
VPNVDSVLVGMRRRASAVPVSPALRGLVSGGFAHRRKTLAGSLGLSAGAPGRSREDVRAALQRLGHPADARAERLSPEDFRELARALEL